MQVSIDKRDKVYKDGIGWNGLNGLRNGKHPCIPNTPETLHSQGLQYHKERDRDAINTILTIAVQLVIEQGRREIKQEVKQYMYLLEPESYAEKLISKIIKD